MFLLIEAGLFARTLHSMRSMDLGFDRDHVATFTLRPDHKTREGNPAPFEQTMVAEARQIPGVDSAAFAQLGLLRDTGMKTTVGLPGERVTKAQFMNSSLNAVSPEYFDTMGIRMVQGRGLATTDRFVEGRPTPVVVNQTLAHRFFPAQDPVGKVLGTGSGILKATHQIVGVSSDSQYRSLREPVPPTYYGPFSGEYGSANILHLRAAGDPCDTDCSRP